MKILVLTAEPVSAPQLKDALPGHTDPSALEVMVVAPALHDSALRFWLSDADDAIAMSDHARFLNDDRVWRFETMVEKINADHENALYLHELGQVVDLGVDRVGHGIVAALDPSLMHRLAEAEWDQLMQDCQPQRVLHDVNWREQASALAQRHGVTAHSYDELWGAPGPSGGAMGQTTFDRAAEPLLDRSSEDDERPLLLVYTSGTTGRQIGRAHV